MHHGLRCRPVITDRRQVAEREDGAGRQQQAVAAARRRRRHVDHLLPLRRRATERGCTAERLHVAVGARQPVAGRSRDDSDEPACAGCAASARSRLAEREHLTRCRRKVVTNTGDRRGDPDDRRVEREITGREVGRASAADDLSVRRGDPRTSAVRRERDASRSPPARHARAQKAHATSLLERTIVAHSHERAQRRDLRVDDRTHAGTRLDRRGAACTAHRAIAPHDPRAGLATWHECRVVNARCRRGRRAKPDEARRYKSQRQH